MEQKLLNKIEAKDTSVRNLLKNQKFIKHLLSIITSYIDNRR